MLSQLFQHFLFCCQIYTLQRRKLFINTREFQPLSTMKLIPGIQTSQNKILFQHVQKYI